MFAGAQDGMRAKIVENFKGCDVSARFLSVRGCVDLKRLFQEVDLVLMPSSVEGFGLTGLEALSAGLPVLVNKNSGFGEALHKVNFGSQFTVDSEDPRVWTAAIKKMWEKDRQSRLEEAKTVRTHYLEKYNWAEQTRILLDEIVNMTHGMTLKL